MVKKTTTTSSIDMMVRKKSTVAISKKKKKKKNLTKHGMAVGKYPPNRRGLLQQPLIDVAV